VTGRDLSLRIHSENIVGILVIMIPIHWEASQMDILGRGVLEGINDVGK